VLSLNGLSDSSLRTADDGSECIHVNIFTYVENTCLDRHYTTQATTVLDLGKLWRYMVTFQIRRTLPVGKLSPEPFRIWQCRKNPREFRKLVAQHLASHCDWTIRN